ncbi:L-serine ammonia-lyase, iron-sulfur-dependent, subunit alpha [Thermoanaerobacterium butyriciformans]|uniref:L-serine ammonia-lyase, iron-sulfur-dependent, subunit alpha n=1 Tax=Thermoanaerobacterium butyriciformans TaxID=1702242 RepID=UPI001AE7F913|nr:L-serine ammonia-lyase, iron-sulfur-dependent, subunit alpha [Thermoanaerobacterium butyriciformans]
MYQFNSGFELLELTRKYNMPISEVVINYEHEMTGNDREIIINKMKANLDVMRKAIEKGLKDDIKSVGGFIGGDAKRLYDKIINNFTISGETVSKAVASAIAVSEVNASMGKIVAAPTAGSSGVIPGALITIARKFGKSDDELIRSLFTSSGIGIIIAKNSTLSGAEGGCQAEVGSASAMAAAALVELMGGSPDESLNAASFAIMNLLGLVCDPVAGLVEVPCVTRNAIGTANALICADLALSGMKSIIPFDDVISAMDSVGKMMPCALKETAEGGLANTTTGIKFKMNFSED